jgi:Tol biopolymer transport system component
VLWGSRDLRTTVPSISLVLLVWLLVSCGQDNPPTSPAGSLQVTLAAPADKYLDCAADVQVQATARQADGSVVAGLALRFRVESGGGTLTPETVLTDSSGVAATLWRLGAGGNVVNTVSVSATDPATGADSTYTSVSVTTRTRLAFGTGPDGQGDIYTINPDGSNEVRLTDTPGDDSSPVWSPDGRRLAFLTTRDGNYEIYVMDADGGAATNLTRSPDVEYDQAWSPDGKTIAFTRGDHLYTMSASGTTQTDLTPTSVGFSPAWSPDGRLIAFATNVEVWVMDANGSNPTQLSHGLSLAAYQYGPAWSPDGNLVAYLWRNSIYVGGIRTNTPDGANEVTRFTGESLPQELAWSPDGTRIAMVDLQGLKIVPLDGTQATSVAADGARGVAWSPDGGTIAFVAGPIDGASAIYTVDSAGNDQRMIREVQGTGGMVWSGCAPSEDQQRTSARATGIPSLHRVGGQ